MAGEKDVEAVTSAEVTKSIPAWHNMTKEEVIKELDLSEDVRKTGLTSAQVKTRLEKYGENQLTAKEKETLLQKIWKQINNVLVGILLFVAVISAVRIATADPVTNGIQVAIIIGVIV
jgi:Ca2+-transporting ATPase